MTPVQDYLRRARQIGVGEVIDQAVVVAKYETVDGVDSPIRRAFSPLPRADTDTLLGLLTKVLDELKAYRGPRRSPAPGADEIAAAIAPAALKPGDPADSILTQALVAVRLRDPDEGTTRRLYWSLFATDGDDVCELVRKVCYDLRRSGRSAIAA